MREIEVKARVKSADDVLKAAESLGMKFGKPIEQFDTTYENNLPNDDPNWNIFRIRKQDGRHILTMKHHASSQSRDNYEYETLVEDEKEMVKILNRLGFEHSIDLHKVRRTTKYKDVEICLDEVDDLGTFVEAEKLTDDIADVEQIQNELWNLLAKLGAKRSDRVFNGYDTLMAQLLHGHSEGQ